MNWLKFPSLSALRAFAALVEEGSVQKAGNALNVSHAAISQQLRQLEERLGIALVDRSGRQLVLTENGERLGRALMDGFSEMARVIQDITGEGDQRPLQVSLTPTFAANWLMPRLADFTRSQPDVDILLNPTPQLVALQPGGVELAIRYGKGTWSGMESHLLFKAPMVVVASPDLVGGRKFTNPAQLAEFPWLLELGSTEVSDWLADYGAQTKKRSGWIELPGNLSLDGARNGQGVIMTARAFIEQDLEAGRLRELFTIELGKGYYICTRPGVQRPALRAFCRWMAKQANNDAAEKVS